LGFRAQGLRLRVWRFGFWELGSGFLVSGLRLQVWDARFRIYGFEFRVKDEGSGFRFSGLTAVEAAFGVQD